MRAATRFHKRCRAAGHFADYAANTLALPWPSVCASRRSSPDGFLAAAADRGGIVLPSKDGRRAGRSRRPVARQWQGSVVGDAHQHLADVLAAHQADKGGWGVLDAVDNRFGQADAVLGKPATHLGKKGRPAVNMVAHKKAA